MDQPKLERLLRLMKMLTANNSLTVDEIADKLGISSRSVYRYIDTFREAGFVIKKSNNCPKLDKSSPYFKDISRLIHFTEEEAYILKSAIESIDENNLLKQNLKKKLYTVYDYNILAETIVSGKNGRNVEERIVSKTLLDVVTSAGAEGVKALGIMLNGANLVSNTVLPRYSTSQKQIGNNLYVMTCCDTNTKQKIIEQISESLNLHSKVERVSII